MTASTATGLTLSRRAFPSWLSGLAVFAVLVAVSGGAVALQLPDFGRFSSIPVVLVCIGSVGFAAAAMILAAEPAQRGNAALFGLAALLFAMEWAFTWPRTPLPFLALPFGQLFAICLGVILLRYPNARLTRPSERWLVCGAVAFTVLARGLWAVTTRPQWFAFGIAAGHGHLPASTVWPVLYPNRDLSRLIAIATDVGQLVAVPAFLAFIVRRVRRESRLMRAELMPVVIGCFLLGSVLLAHLIAVLISNYQPAAAPDEWISAALSLTVVVIPVTFVIAGVQRRLARAAIADLVVTLARPHTAVEIQDALRHTMGDNDLELLYRLPESDSYVSTEGRPVETPTDSCAGLVVPVADRYGSLLAVVRTGHDERRHPRLLTSAVAASSLAIENTRLEAQLRAQLQEVRESRRRVVAATLEERRRLERDLHDGVQQQLLSIGAVVGQLALRSGDGSANQDLLDEIRDQLRQTRHEVRLLARGLHPAALNERGLAAAIGSAASRLPLEVDVDIPSNRWPPDVEVTAYFVASEALANCVAHSGGKHVRVNVRVDGGHLVLQVADDGQGGADFRAGGGLSGLRDRVQSLGGDLTVQSAARVGTVVEMTLPCA
jgi:signal transduction histidine kinase